MTKEWPCVLAILVMSVLSVASGIKCSSEEAANADPTSGSQTVYSYRHVGTKYSFIMGMKYSGTSNMVYIYEWASMNGTVVAGAAAIISKYDPTTNTFGFSKAIGTVLKNQENSFVLVEGSPDYIYLAAQLDGGVDGTIAIIKMDGDTSSLTIYDAYWSSSLNSLIKLEVDPSNSNVFHLLTNNLNVCKITFTPPSPPSAPTLQCVAISGLASGSTYMNKVSGNSYFLYSFYSYDMRFIKFDITTASAVASALDKNETTLNCPVSSCYYYYSPSYYDSSNSKIYIFFPYGYYWDSYFIIFDETNLAVDQMRYSSRHIHRPRDITKYTTPTGVEKLIIAVDLASEIGLMTYNYTNGAFELITITGYFFTSKIQITGDQIFLSSGRIPPKIISSAIDSINMLPGFESGLNSNLSFPIISNAASANFSSTSAITGVTANPIPTVNVNALTYATADLTQITIESSISDLVHNVDNYTFEIPVSTAGELTFNKTCSLNNVTEMRYEFKEVTGERFPNFLGEFTQEGKLEYNTKGKVEETFKKINPLAYKFNYVTYAQVSSGGDEPLGIQLITLNIVECKVEYCDVCTTGDPSKCDECETGYSLDANNACVRDPMSEDASLSSTSNKVASGFSTGVATSTALLNLSAPTAVWALANQLQILLTLVLTGAYLPTKIEDYISGQTFASFNFDFIPVFDIPVVKIPLEALDFNHTDIKMKTVGVVSGSSFVNNIGFLITILALIFCHMILSCLCRLRPTEDERCCRRCYRVTHSKFLRTMKWGIYIRLLLEAYMILMISSLAEFSFNREFSGSLFSTQNLCNIGSALVSLCLIIVCIIFLSKSIYYIKRKTKETDRDKHHFMEFYSGLKSANKARFYICFFMVKRTIIAVTVVYLKQVLPLWHTLVVILLLQFANQVYLHKVRPFEELQDNVIETLNEIYFTFFLIVQIQLQKKEDWEDQTATIMLFILTSNNFIVTIILLVFFCISCKRKCKAKSKEEKKKVIDLANPTGNDGVSLNLQQLQSQFRIGSSVNSISHLKHRSHLHFDSQKKPKLFNFNAPKKLDREELYKRNLNYNLKHMIEEKKKEEEDQF
ncbi:unnamed protein product [Moneuplotes crassus]|uniref:TRP C-terminal domain-containing protein n=1 Tax=Euplotes crassus TaxID=5936 RepID=A0AAD1YBM4_EUPCR|nr:unnamed protein product [Moneuplotes crassus]